MLNITFLVGPPASGKSFIAHQMMSMFPEHRTIVTSFNDKKRLSSILKHREFYNAICIEEANNSILAKLEDMIVMHSTDNGTLVVLSYSQNATSGEWVLGTKSIIEGLKISLDKEIQWCNDHNIALEKAMVLDENERYFQDSCIPEMFALGWVFNIHDRYDHVTIEECVELYERIYENLNIQG